MLYPIGIQNFEKIRKDGYIYVDKTEHIFRMAQKGGYYFLSRPRRFGKSLLVSTLESYFSGKKELFEGLAVASLETDWIQYPVLRFDLTGKSYTCVEDLQQYLDAQLSVLENRFEIIKSSDSADIRFQRVIEAAYNCTGHPAVILIDEYDKPIVDNLGNESLSDIFRKILQGFYSVMKTKDEFIRFGFLTGVTKIGKLSIFSGLNNLKDISMDGRFADICGLSQEEIHYYFSDSIDELANANGLTRDDTCRQLAQMYDGYHFCEDSEGIYNPFSVLNTFESLKFKEYWFETGTPSFLIKIMKDTSYDVSRLSEDEVGSNLLTDVDSALANPVPFLYQAGYLTIKDYDKEYKLYKVGFPNKEVKDGFLNYLLNFYAPVQTESTTALISRMSRDIRNGDAEGFILKLEALFSKTNYQIQGDSEKDFQYAIYIILELMGEYAEVEKSTSNGRIDVLIQTREFIYIIELKVDNTANAALQQIEEKGYAKPFVSDPRKLFKIGVSFSTRNRRIEDWKIVE